MAYEMYYKVLDRIKFSTISGIYNNNINMHMNVHRHNNHNSYQITICHS